MSSDRIRVLFVCVQNSFRSQVAQAIMSHKYGNQFEAESAGLNVTKIHPLAIEAMRDYGVDISKNTVDSVFDYYKEGRIYSYVITVCSRENEKECPIFPGIKMRLNWDLENPEYYTGTDQEKSDRARKLVFEIEKRIDEFISAVQSQ